jgi:hypothetical protein
MTSMMVSILALQLLPPIAAAHLEGPIASAVTREAVRIAHAEDSHCFLGGGRCARAMPAYAAPTDDLRDLERFEGQLIYVQLVSAEEILARLVTADDAVLVVTVGGTRRDIASSRIHQVSIRGDRLRNGIQIGAGIGAAWGILGTQGGVGHPTVGVALMTALGAAVGAWVDARHVGRTVVYRSSH